MKRRWSIRARLFALVLVVAMPLVAVFVLSLWADLQNDAREARDSALSLARLTASSVELLLADTLSEFGGTGIGLATVQRIIHRHGGRHRPGGYVLLHVRIIPSRA